VGFAAVVAGAGAVEDVDVGAGEAFEDRDCCGVRDAVGRGLAHAPLCVCRQVCFWMLCAGCVSYRGSLAIVVL
jgi:hypothetical protein